MRRFVLWFYRKFKATIDQYIREEQKKIIKDKNKEILSPIVDDLLGIVNILDVDYLCKLGCSTRGTIYKYDSELEKHRIHITNRFMGNSMDIECYFVSKVFPKHHLYIRITKKSNDDNGYDMDISITLEDRATKSIIKVLDITTKSNDSYLLSDDTKIDIYDEIDLSYIKLSPIITIMNDNIDTFKISDILESNISDNIFNKKYI